MSKMNRLRQLRLRAQLTQVEVAQVMQCSPSVVCIAEQGRVGSPSEFGGSRAVTSRAMAAGMELFLLDYLEGAATKEGFGVPRTNFDAFAALYPSGAAHIVDETGVPA